MTAILKTATLGCKVNQYETQWVREGLRQIGYRDADSPEQAADLCLVNTCTVTEEGDAKSRKLIRRLHRENPRARIVVMGCYAARAPADVQRLAGVSEVLVDKREIPDWMMRQGVRDVPRGVSRLDHRARVYIKVQDGCLLRCSYCIIPFVRPHMASRPVEELVDEVTRVVEAGAREIVLTGIHLGHFGVDQNRGRPKSEWWRLARLVQRLDAIPLEFRMRLSSLEATELTRELVAVIADLPERVCPHLHVCLQSGSDLILRRMRRRWGVRQIVDRCREIQRRLPDPALTTDVIVGFPGESEADFAQTLDVCRQIGFSKIHAFPFSPRKGTPAATMDGAVDPAVKSERVARLGRLECELRRAYFERLVGRPLQVLVEACENGQAQGTACRFATVRAAAPAARIGRWLSVRARQATEDHLIADPLAT